MTRTVKEVKKEVKNTQVKNTQAKSKVDTQAKDTHTRKSTIDKKLVVKLFNKGLTPYQIAKQIGKYYSQVAPILEREGFTWEKRSTEPTGKRSRTIYCSDEQYAKIQELLKK